MINSGSTELHSAWFLDGTTSTCLLILSSYIDKVVTAKDTILHKQFTKYNVLMTIKTHASLHKQYSGFLLSSYID